MVVMAVVTTVMAGPLLSWIIGHPTGGGLPRPPGRPAPVTATATAPGTGHSAGTAGTAA